MAEYTEETKRPLGLKKKVELRHPGTVIRHVIPGSDGSVQVRKYKLIRHLGSGQYGHVYECEECEVDNPIRLAIKISLLGDLKEKIEAKRKLLDSKSFLPKNKEPESKEEEKKAKPEDVDIRNEIRIQTVLGEFSGIVRLFDFFNDNDFSYITMELCEGNTLGYLIKECKIRTNCAISYLKFVEYAWQLSLVVYRMKKSHILHRDIKPENIFFVGKERDKLKLADFGLSETMKYTIRDKKKLYHKLNVRAGTPFYIAPDVLKCCYGFKADVWSLGMVFYEMCYGTLPFPSNDSKDVIECVLDKKFQIPFPDKVNPAIIDLLQSMLQYDDQKRFSIKQVIMHPLFKENRDKQRLRRARLQLSMS